MGEWIMIKIGPTNMVIARCVLQLVAYEAMWVVLRSNWSIPMGPRLEMQLLNEGVNYFTVPRSQFGKGTLQR